MAKYRGACGSKEGEVADFKHRVHIWVDVTNEGSCPIKVRFFKTTVEFVWGAGWLGFPALVPEHYRELTKTVPPGKTVSVDRDEVNRVTISCEGKEGARHSCKFTYSIRAD
jgi:hypothetical protein